MYSDVIKAALEKEVVGQTIAVNTMVRGVTRLVSGLTPRDRSLFAYMFMGPPGTGKSQVIKAVAHLLHGDERRIATVDCSGLAHGDPRMALAAQLTPLFNATMPGGRYPSSEYSVEAPPLSIVLLDYLERATEEACMAIVSILETGRLTFPDGRQGGLRNCLLFLTSRLCCGKILDEAPQIGFSGALDEDDGAYEDHLFKLCYEEAEQRFGIDLVGQLDRFVVFHPLQEEHLSEILDRRVGRLNQWLASRGLTCELQPAAREFLIEKGRRNLRLGARDLLRAHQQFVEFPIADLLVSGRTGAGRVVLVDRHLDEEHLHFTLTPSPDQSSPTPVSPFVLEIPVGH